MKQFALKIEQGFEEWLKGEGENFSGVFAVQMAGENIFQKGVGYRNVAEKLENLPSTSFAVASITKFFTALAIGKLIDKNLLQLHDEIGQILTDEIGKINRNITILQLLNHTSGVGDYIDEDAEDLDAVLNDLYAKYPSYLWKNMDYYLQMSTDIKAKFSPGERMSYSNTGYVLLGLIIEKLSGQSFQTFVTKEIIEPLNLVSTGFYSMNQLPPNTAIGYIDEFTTNIFSVPIIGGSDGGIYTCCDDLDMLWRNVIKNNVLSGAVTDMIFDKTVGAYKDAFEEGDEILYGLGVYLYRGQTINDFYYVAGYDAGTDCISAHCPKRNITISVLGNTMDFDKYKLVVDTFSYFE